MVVIKRTSSDIGLGFLHPVILDLIYSSHVFDINVKLFLRTTDDWINRLESFMTISFMNDKAYCRARIILLSIELRLVIWLIPGPVRVSRRLIHKDWTIVHKFVVEILNVLTLGIYFFSSIDWLILWSSARFHKGEDVLVWTYALSLFFFRYWYYRDFMSLSKVWIFI